MASIPPITRPVPGDREQFEYERRAGMGTHLVSICRLSAADPSCNSGEVREQLQAQRIRRGQEVNAKADPAAGSAA
jgi:hypothetical protein